MHLLASFDHPYVIRYYDSFVDDEASQHPDARGRPSTPMPPAIRREDVQYNIIYIICII